MNPIPCGPIDCMPLARNAEAQGALKQCQQHWGGVSKSVNQSVSHVKRLVCNTHTHTRNYEKETQPLPPGHVHGCVKSPTI